MKIAVLLSSIAERTYPQLWPTMVDDFIQTWIHSTLPRYYTVMMMMYSDGDDSDDDDEYDDEYDDDDDDDDDGGTLL